MNMAHHLRDENFAKHLSMLDAAERFLEHPPTKHPAHANIVRQASMLRQDEFALAFAIGDLREIALNPNVLVTPNTKRPGRFLELFSRYPDLTAALFARLRSAAESPTATHKAIEYLRTNPIADDKTIASAMHTSPDVVKKARQRLAGMDAHMWEPAKAKRKSRKSPAKGK